MYPLVAPAGTVAVMLLAVLVCTAAGVPLNSTTGAAPKLYPLIVTLVPGAPSVGLKVVTTVGLFGPLPVSTMFFR